MRLLLGFGRGEVLRGAGGVAVLWVEVSSMIGGVGMGGGFIALRFSEVSQQVSILLSFEHTNSPRFGNPLGAPEITVGEEVC